MTSFTYAGIGARATPEEVLVTMTNVARNLELSGWTLHSGGAKGADQAFERGVWNEANMRIFLPWAYFNQSKSRFTEPSRASYVMAEQFHPAWHRCSVTARKFHARNCHQILGWDLEHPVDFVLCYTADGQSSGGTGQALRIAQHHNIPIFNMHNGAWDIPFNALMNFLRSTPA